MGDEARTFAELDAGSNRAAHRLMGEGVRPGDRVVWWGPSVLDALELGYGISKAGATLSPINPHFTEPEAVAALETLAPRLVVAHPDVADAAHAATDPLGVPIVVMHDGWTEGAAASSPPRVGDGEDPSVVFLTIRVHRRVEGRHDLAPGRVATRGRSATARTARRNAAARS